MTADAGHGDVEQDEVRQVGARGREAKFAVCGDHHTAVVAEQRMEGAEVEAFIVDDEHGGLVGGCLCEAHGNSESSCRRVAEASSKSNDSVARKTAAELPAKGDSASSWWRSSARSMASGLS